jgi:hypothetical protein
MAGGGVRGYKGLRAELLPAASDQRQLDLPADGN